MLIENRQRTRQTEADRAGIRVRRIAELGGAAAEDFRRGLQLDVDFETDNGLVSRSDFRDDSGDFGRGSGHGEFRDYNILDGEIPEPQTTRASSLAPAPRFGAAFSFVPVSPGRSRGAGRRARLRLRAAPRIPVRAIPVDKQWQAAPRGGTCPDAAERPGRHIPPPSLDRE